MFDALPLRRMESVGLRESLGRHIAEAVLSERYQPPSTLPPWTAGRCAEQRKDYIGWSVKAEPVPATSRT